jgi:hypothetical protein
VNFVRQINESDDPMVVIILDGYDNLTWLDDSMHPVLARANA